MNTTSDITNIAKEESSAKYRVSCGPGWVDGKSMKAGALSSGTPTRARRTYSMPLDDHQQEHDGDHDEPGGDGEGIVRQLTGLQKLQLEAREVGQAGRAVNARVVDDVTVEP